MALRFFISLIALSAPMLVWAQQFAPAVVNASPIPAHLDEIETIGLGGAWLRVSKTSARLSPAQHPEHAAWPVLVVDLIGPSTPKGNGNNPGQPIAAHVIQQSLKLPGELLRFHQLVELQLTHFELVKQRVAFELELLPAQGVRFSVACHFKVYPQQLGSLMCGPVNEPSRKARQVAKKTNWLPTTIHHMERQEFEKGYLRLVDYAPGSAHLMAVEYWQNQPLRLLDIQALSGDAWPGLGGLQVQSTLITNRAIIHIFANEEGQVQAHCEARMQFERLGPFRCQGPDWRP